jgi:hypothetical protein
MQGDLYPREVVVSVLTDSSINIFGDHTGDDLFSRYLRNQKSPWLKVSRRRFKKIVAYFKHGSPFL